MKLEQLRITFPDECAILEFHFIHDKSANMIANRINVAEGTVFTWFLSSTVGVGTIIANSDGSPR